MRKVAVVLCVVVLALIMATTAMAAPSAGALIPTGTGISAANPAAYASSEAADIVTRFNAGESITVEGAIDLLNNLIIVPDTLTVDPAEWEFVSAEFVDIIAEDAAQAITIPGLVGVTDLSDYMIMLIDTATGDVYLIELDPESFDATTGTVVVDLPVSGAITLIQRIAE